MSSCCRLIVGKKVASPSPVPVKKSSAVRSQTVSRAASWRKMFLRADRPTSATRFSIVMKRSSLKSRMQKKLSFAHLSPAESHAVSVRNAMASTSHQARSSISAKQWALLPHKRSVNRVHSLRCVRSIPAASRNQAATSLWDSRVSKRSSRRVCRRFLQRSHVWMASLPTSARKAKKPSSPLLRTLVR